MQRRVEVPSLKLAILPPNLPSLCRQASPSTDAGKASCARGADTRFHRSSMRAASLSSSRAFVSAPRWSHRPPARSGRVGTECPPGMSRLMTLADLSSACVTTCETRHILIAASVRKADCRKSTRKRLTSHAVGDKPASPRKTSFQVADSPCAMPPRAIKIQGTNVARPIVCVGNRRHFVRY